MSAKQKKNAVTGQGRGFGKYIQHNWQLWVMLLPAIIYIFIFCYVPMYGVQLAFREYDFKAGIYGGKWVGFKYFKQFFDNINKFNNNENRQAACYMMK